MKKFVAIFFLTLFTTYAQAIQRPKLVVVIVIDQFRADYLSRFESKFLPSRTADGKVGGFRYLMQEGAYYPLAQYQALQCMTAPGHATILSGANPYLTGIPVNEWFDSKEQKRIYAVEDDTFRISPRRFRGNTIGDELKNAGYDSKVVSISLKDRSAVLLGGFRSDLSVWMDEKEARWTTSPFYLKEGTPLPKELLSENEKLKGQNLKKQISPTGTTWTTDGAIALARAFSLGKHGNTDLLALSYSSHDFVGHIHGPNSSEIEEMTIGEDKEISRLLNTLNTLVPGGLKKMTVVLTADHGVGPLPELLANNRMHAGRIPEKDLVSGLEGYLKDRFGKANGGSYIADVSELNFYFKPGVSKSAGSDTALFEAAKNYLREQKGIQAVFSREDYEKKLLPPGIFEKMILNTYVPGRSGDVVAIPTPYFIPGKNSATHITGYAYDRTVPIVFAGMSIKKGVYLNESHVVDIAPTLAGILGTVAPSLSEGRVLSEAISLQ